MKHVFKFVEIFVNLHNEVIFSGIDVLKFFVAGDHVLTRQTAWSLGAEIIGIIDLNFAVIQILQLRDHSIWTVIKTIARVVYLIYAVVFSPWLEFDTIYDSIKRFIFFNVDDGSVGICSVIRAGWCLDYLWIFIVNTVIVQLHGLSLIDRAF